MEMFALLPLIKYQVKKKKSKNKIMKTNKATKKLLFINLIKGKINITVFK